MHFERPTGKVRFHECFFYNEKLRRTKITFFFEIYLKKGSLLLTASLKRDSSSAPFFPLMFI